MGEKLEIALLIAVCEDWLLHASLRNTGIDVEGVRAQLATLRALNPTSHLRAGGQRGD